MSTEKPPTHIRPLPLNSKKLTGLLLKQLARGLEIASSSSGDELRQLIEGKLEDGGHDPRNVQVLLQEVENGMEIMLQDDEGMFLMVNSVTEEISSDEEVSGNDMGDGQTTEDVLKLKEALLTAEEEIASLKAQLLTEKEKYKQLWRLNCIQLEEFDSAESRPGRNHRWCVNPTKGKSSTSRFL